MPVKSLLITGGGSGGHITPALAVARELKEISPGIKIFYVGQTGDILGDVPEQNENIDQVFSIRAGKLRRYHMAGLAQLFNFKTLYKNLRDAFWVVVGFWQSLWLLGQLKPDAIFTRGSYVSVPLCWAAAIRKIPYITHDSDALPGLSNRLIARWAKINTVALPEETYSSYRKDKVLTVGVPVSRDFGPVSSKQIEEWKQSLGVESAGRILFVTGGGQGSERVNSALVAAASELLERYPDLYILHIAGRRLESALRKQYSSILDPNDLKRIIIKGFVINFYQYSGVADLIVTRSGMTSITEFASQVKPCIVVPATHLSGGHQLQNAKILSECKAARMVNESVLKDDPKALLPALTDLLDNPEKAEAMARRLATLAHPDAARKLAVLLLEIAKH